MPTTLLATEPRCRRGRAKPKHASALRARCRGHATGLRGREAAGHVGVSGLSKPQIALERVVDPETGMLYLRARYYDPSTGQFLTRDPMDAVTRSAYGYSGNDPLNGSDPTGLMVSGYCMSGRAFWWAGVSGSVCIVSDGHTMGILEIGATGAGSPNLSIDEVGFVSSAKNVKELTTGTSKCFGGTMGPGPAIGAELCTNNRGYNTVFFAGGIHGEPGAEGHFEVSGSRYQSFTDIYRGLCHLLNPGGPGPTQYHNNGDGTYGSGGVSPNQDASGAPVSRWG